MRIVSWNVNSIAVRLERVVAYLDREKPDVLCLQELKAITDKFPYGPFVERGYACSVLGQKTYNGVAILSRELPLNVEMGMNRGEDYDEQARVIRADFERLSIVSAYVPNGQAVGSDKYQFKLAWLERFASYLNDCLAAKRNLVVVGDFNVAPEDCDVYDPIAWKESILCSSAERAALRNITSQGLVDSFRLQHQEGGRFSWWDYRQLAFPKNRGLRIDLCLVSDALIPNCVDSGIDREERKGQQPSDHAPVWVEIRDQGSNSIGL